MVAAPFLSVRDARIVFGDRVVASALALDFHGGRTTCLLGRSGVGKTSLLPGAERTQPTAYMAQRDLLLPWLGLLDNVLLGFRLRGDSPGLEAAVPRARRLLTEVGLGDRLGDRPETLSAGMRQRAALARTLCEDRQVVLMDEPFAHLDAVTRLDLQDLAVRLLAGKTVILVTHDPLEALRMGHQVRVLSGSPFAVGPALEPPGAVPRDPTDPVLLGLQGRLIAELRSTP